MGHFAGAANPGDLWHGYVLAESHVGVPKLTMIM